MSSAHARFCDFRSFSPAPGGAASRCPHRRSIGFAFVLATILASAGSQAQAQSASCFWSVPSGDWSVASNWRGTLPTSSDYASIINGGTASITLPWCGLL